MESESCSDGFTSHPTHTFPMQITLHPVKGSGPSRPAQVSSWPPLFPSNRDAKPTSSADANEGNSAAVCTGQPSDKGLQNNPNRGLFLNRRGISVNTNTVNHRSEVKKVCQLLPHLCLHIWTMSSYTRRNEHLLNESRRSGTSNSRPVVGEVRGGSEAEAWDTY